MENVSEVSYIGNPKPNNFQKFLPWACKNYSILPDVLVTKVSQAMYQSGSKLETKRSRTKSQLRQSKVVQPLVQSDHTIDDKDILSEAPVGNESVIMVEAIYNINDDLVHLKFLKNKTIPREVMAVVALTIPYHKHLISITINSGLHMETLHEISKFLPDSNITEICLDDTFLSKANYCTLLTHGKLKHLSLARCSINDTVVKTITDQLGAASPASRVLSALNLSSNRITDAGAKYVAGMLRTNRQLSYLNLAGNMITDEGGVSILDTLQKFPLEAQEIFDSRTRYVAFLRNKNELSKTLTIELHAAKEDRMAKKKSAKNIKLESQSQLNDAKKRFVTETENEARLIREKAALLAESKMGLFNDHFSPNNTESQDGVVRCFGNNTLCCLNLAYNNLTYVSVKKLRDVLVTQRSLNRAPRGLIQVIIQGNWMPVACEEYDEINHLLESRLVAIRKHAQTLTKSKVTISRSNK